MKCVYRMRPYELEKGIVNRKHKIWEQRVIAFVTGSSVSHGTFKKMCREMVHDFDTIPISDDKKPRVGIVGEILVKFLPAANNHLAELLEAEGAEPVVPDLIDFMSYCFYNQNFNHSIPLSRRTLYHSFSLYYSKLKNSIQAKKPPFPKA